MKISFVSTLFFFLALAHGATGMRGLQYDMEVTEVGAAAGDEAGAGEIGAGSQQKYPGSGSSGSSSSSSGCSCCEAEQQATSLLAAAFQACGNWGKGGYRDLIEVEPVVESVVDEEEIADEPLLSAEEEQRKPFLLLYAHKTIFGSLTQFASLFSSLSSPSTAKRKESAVSLSVPGRNDWQDYSSQSRL